MINLKYCSMLLILMYFLGINISQVQSQSNAQLPLTIRDLEYSPNGDYIARIYSDARLVISEVSNGNIVFEAWMPIETSYTVARVAWSPNGDYLAAGAGSQANIIRIDDFQVTYSLYVGNNQPIINTDFGEVIPEGVISLGWDISGILLMSKSVSGRYTVWDTSDMALIVDYSIDGVSEYIPVVWLADDRYISTGFSVFDIQTQSTALRLGNQIPDVVGNCSVATSIETNSPRTQIVQGTANGCVVVIDGETGDHIIFYQVTGVDNPLWGVSWSPDDSRIAAVDSIGNLYVIEIATEIITVFNVNNSLLATVDWHPNSQEIAYGGHTPDGEAEIFGIIQFPTADAGADQTLTADGSGFATVTLDGSASFDPDGEIVSYVWTLNDVEIATGAIAQVQLGVGVHEVTLTVTDDDGAVGVDSVVVTVAESLSSR